MSEEINKIVLDLGKLGYLDALQKDFGYYLDEKNKQSFIESYCEKIKKEFDREPRRPEKKTVPSNPNKTLIVGIVLIALGVLGFIWCLKTTHSNETDPSVIKITGGLFAGIFGFSFFVTGIREIKHNWIPTKKEYERAMSYNNNEYQKLYREYETHLKAYNDAKSKYEKEFKEQKELAEKDWVTKKEEALEKLPKVKEEIKKYDFLDESYYPHIIKLMNIFKKGRADSLISAINVLENDLHNERMEALEEERLHQQKAAQRQRELDEIYRRNKEEEREREMLEIAERQARAAEDQARTIEEQARRAEKQEAERKRKFEDAQSRYNAAIYARDVQSEGLREYNQRKADEAFADMLKYK